MAVLQTSRLHGEKIATCGIFLRKKKDNFLTKIFKNFYNLCINVERRINKHVIYYHCTAVTEKMQVFRTDFLFLTIMSHKKMHKFLVVVFLSGSVFINWFSSGKRSLCLEKKIKKKRFVTTFNYNLQKYICKIMEEKKRSPTEEDNEEESRRSSRRKKAKVCPELTRLSLCCYKCNALCSNIFAFIIL